MYVDIVISNAFNLNNFFFLLEYICVTTFNIVKIVILSVSHTDKNIYFIRTNVPK